MYARRRTSDYPRLRGDDFGMLGQRWAASGLPPPARGRRQPSGAPVRVGRITPACAGTTACSAPPNHRRADYPRLRGDDGQNRRAGRRLRGLPPSARGRRLPECGCTSKTRITPACAGTTPGTGSDCPGRPDYPRLRGDDRKQRRRAERLSGLPPPARGRRDHGDGHRRPGRITPACAGTTAVWRCPCCAGADYPRLRGDDSAGCLMCDAQFGLPPPARGRPLGGGGVGVEERITPACAGTTKPQAGWQGPAADYPRLRGDDAFTGVEVSELGGLPPPARGRPEAAARPVRAARITPACAGTTSDRSGIACARPDYPRLRGDDLDIPPFRDGIRGLPPPARGRLHHGLVERRDGRITPACAGTTLAMTCARARPPDYPRLRGDDFESSRSLRASAGLPPPARGRLWRSAWPASCDRITPACAGTTTPAARSPGSGADYPRLRGDDSQVLATAKTKGGLPPPARGRLHQLVGADVVSRITPACAGTTEIRTWGSRTGTDYPRLRGDDSAANLGLANGYGLPPPARGRQRRELGARERVRITPACAGTTAPRTWGSRTGTDYPRLRGDDSAANLGLANGYGLPPPARGRQRRELGARERVRITPACAGTTAPRTWGSRTGTDYPRLRGDDRPSTRRSARPAGLPPPARGRQAIDQALREAGWITPACAGTTGHRPGAPRGRLDYPRLRGDDRPSTRRSARPAGLPPPARGRQAIDQALREAGWITPACAGTTGHRPGAPRGRLDYPRLRGDDRPSTRRSARPAGLPPPARGRQAIDQALREAGWITPACAGTTGHRPGAPPGRRVAPDLVEQSSGAAEQGDPAAYRCRGDLSQQGGRHPARRGRAGRADR
ncbi:hypothetical protein PACID_29950 [Acidipropionibacterium acidipropionici ATCC 4875]|uniref:Uncharacterized protein n=1 Tax=Acidipropionibacterium acidipropionici (strain ATCC 4875 / DSM 20272 / JCM 6432 / NBRC 12425 / NCIMB 8070 / 4) TaxID=1171373 RepID=K7SNJ6_ACIA4|nr:hypothetical protein PACID_29950 [Acidipropionibacterium acidipropionici ATCC 4875]